jgi:hypothetical protein
MKHYSIGSVIKIKDTDSLFMIAGFLPKVEKGKTYDYFAVPYPLGLISFDEYICLNADIIGEVVFEGYSDGKTVEFLNGLEELEKNLISMDMSELSK